MGIGVQNIWAAGRTTIGKRSPAAELLTPPLGTWKGCPAASEGALGIRTVPTQPSFHPPAPTSLRTLFQQVPDPRAAPNALLTNQENPRHHRPLPHPTLRVLRQEPRPFKGSRPSQRGCPAGGGIEITNLEALISSQDITLPGPLNATRPYPDSISDWLQRSGKSVHCFLFNSSSLSVTVYLHVHMFSKFLSHLIMDLSAFITLTIKKNPKFEHRRHLQLYNTESDRSRMSSFNK